MKEDLFFISKKAEAYNAPALMISKKKKLSYFFVSLNSNYFISNNLFKLRNLL